MNQILGPTNMKMIEKDIGCAVCARIVNLQESFSTLQKSEAAIVFQNLFQKDDSRLFSASSGSWMLPLPPQLLKKSSWTGTAASAFHRLHLVFESLMR